LGTQLQRYWLFQTHAEDAKLKFKFSITLFWSPFSTYLEN
jgi:hypothetical protein